MKKKIKTEKERKYKDWENGANGEGEVVERGGKRAENKGGQCREREVMENEKTENEKKKTHKSLVLLGILLSFLLLLFFHFDEVFQ